MKTIIIFLGFVIGMMAAQSQTLATFDGANKIDINAFHWTEVNSGPEEMLIATSEHCFVVEFVAQKARMTHETNVKNHISKDSYTSLSGEVIKGILRNTDGKTIGTARFAVIGTSIAGNAEIGNDTYKFAPNSKGEYSWELQQPFQCGTEDANHDCDMQTPEHTHGVDCNHASAVGNKSPMSCVTESIQDVAFVTDDLMTAYGNNLNAIIAQIAISDSWAEDIMNDSGFPDVAFFPESVNVVNFAESGTTFGNLQRFNDSLYITPAGVIATIMQNATSSVTVL